MSYNNVPDDWNSFWEKCSHCGRRYHASEGRCDCLDEGECIGCGAVCDYECLDEGSLKGDGEPIYRCEDCALCEGCGETVMRNTMKDVDGCLYCCKCGKV